LEVLLSDEQDCLQIKYVMNYLAWEIGKSGYCIMGKIGKLKFGVATKPTK
jgi:hypothetical protein